LGDIKPQFKGNLGMFLVCAELSKHNLIAMPTSRNTKGCDIVVLNPDTNKTVGIQVKCTDRKEFPIINAYWRDYEEKIEEKIMTDFVFVDISDPDKADYFIVPEKEMKGVLKSVIEEYLHKYQQKHNLTWEQMLEMEESKKRKSGPWSVELNDIWAYRGRWEIITNRLQKLGH